MPRTERDYNCSSCSPLIELDGLKVKLLAVALMPIRSARVSA